MLTLKTPARWLAWPPPGLLLLLLCVPACGKPASTTGTASAVPIAVDIAAVRHCFDSYKRALVEVDGAAAVSQVDAGTLRYYGDMLDMALHATAEQAQALSASDKILLLTMRHRSDLATLQALDGEGLFIYSVEQQWVGRFGLERNALGEVEIDGDLALGRLRPDGYNLHTDGPPKGSPGGQKAGGQAEAAGAFQDELIVWRFHREAGRWKLDLLANQRLADRYLETVVFGNGQDETAVIFNILQSVSGRRPRDDIWEPLVAR